VSMGFVYDGKEVVPLDLTWPGDPLHGLASPGPERLEPRAAKRVCFPPDTGTDYDLAKVTRVFARTACGVTRYGEGTGVFGRRVAEGSAGSAAPQTGVRR